MDADVECMRVELINHGQEHLLKSWDSLSEEQKKMLHNDLSSIDFAEVSVLFEGCVEQLQGTAEKVDDHLLPLPQEDLGSVSRTDDVTLKQYEEEGLRQVCEDKVAVILLAGGQGSRLGVPYPKGMYDVNLPSHKTLYQLQAERILKIQQLAAKQCGKEGIVPWYVMTSEHTMTETEAFFRTHNYFGLHPGNISFFEQRMLPCVNFEGKIILQTPYKVARAPDGNGGLYRALGTTKVLDDIVNRGVKFVHVYSVDNILVKMADPVFTGFCIKKNACCGIKVVEKAFPTEPVGIVCKVDGAYQIVEYSEITLKSAEKRNADGRLTFNAGGICNHFFTTEFLQMIVRSRESDLKYHIAKKKVPCVGENGEMITPTQPNGIKLEKFVFDYVQFAETLAVWEVVREDEYSPLKNADGATRATPTTSRQSLFRLHQRQVLKAGGCFKWEDGTLIRHLPPNNYEDAGEASVICEISPLLSYSGEGLEEVVRGKHFVPPVYLQSSGEAG